MNEAIILTRLQQMSPGSRSDGFIPLGSMASGARFGLSFIALRGSRPGPCLWTNGQVHGDEINGILAAFDFVDGLRPTELRGSVVISSSAHPLALDARAKNAPHDGYDLDQSFPGQPHGFVTERAADALIREIDAVGPGLLINMHTMPNFMASKPYAVYKNDLSGRIGERQLLEYVAAFEPAFACLVSIEPGRGERLGNLAGALDHQMLARGIPSFMVELGSGSKATPEHIAQGVRGFTAVARRLGLVAEAPPQPCMLTKVTKRARVTFARGGLFRALRQPGDFVAAGETIGRVVDLRGREVDALSLPYPCRLIGIRSDPVVHTGDWFCFVAQQWEDLSLA
jgi:predicted deacylase